MLAVVRTAVYQEGILRNLAIVEAVKFLSSTYTVTQNFVDFVYRRQALKQSTKLCTELRIPS